MPKLAQTPFSGRIMTQVWNAVKQLNPKNVKAEAERAVRLAVVGSPELLRDTAEFLLGGDPSAYERAANAILLITTPLEPAAFKLLAGCDVVLRSSDVEQALPGVPSSRIFTYQSTTDLPDAIKQLLRAPELAYAHLALARVFPAFRAAVAAEIIQNTSMENALFVASTSLGNIIPNPLQPLTSVAESLGDLVVLTANQIRMMFNLAAVFDRKLGINEQAPEGLSMIGAAFGWRSIARELVSHVPYGGGVVPKAAIAFAGTWAIGDGITYYYSTGRRLTREEMRQRFDQAYEKGRKSAETVVSKIREGYTRTSELMKKPGSTDD